MTSDSAHELDVVIFGGGAAGLWLLHALRSTGRRCALLERDGLGSGQTVASQGIIHGGSKYSIAGAVTSSAKNIRDMPRIWRECLAGNRQPDLSRTRLRSDHCFLWQTSSVRSTLGMLGARLSLRVRPVPLARQDRPECLASCPGVVARLDEPVIDPVSFLENLEAPNREYLLQIDPATIRVRREGAQFEIACLNRNERDSRITLRTEYVVITAGSGNEGLRLRFELPAGRSQRRPLHMVMLRGDPQSLPQLCGHCVDGRQTRATITADLDGQGRRIWQVGGQIAEDGVRMDRPELLRHAARELASILPDISFDGFEWSTYRADRAEAATSSGARPDDAQLIVEYNVITAWPTKLALVPRLVDRIIEKIGSRCSEEKNHSECDPPRRASAHSTPHVAPPPWETESQWISDP